MPSRIASDQWAGRTTDEHLTSLTPLTDRPVSIPNKRAYTRFSERTGDNADNSAVPRKNFHSTGSVFTRKEIPGWPVKRPERMDLPGRTGTVDWHGYCTVHVIRGDRSERTSDFQVGIRLSPRLPHLVASEEAVKEMETDGSHYQKGIQQY